MCSAPVRTGGYTKEKYGYQGTKVSGKTASRAPFSAASAMLPSALASVAPGVSRSGAICTAATRLLALSAISHLRRSPPPTLFEHGRIVRSFLYARDAPTLRKRRHETG